MAIGNRERVRKVLECLRSGLGPYVKCEITTIVDYRENDGWQRFLQNKRQVENGFTSCVNSRAVGLPPLSLLLYSLQ